MRFYNLGPSFVDKSKLALILVLVVVLLQISSTVIAVGSGHVVSLSAAPSNNPTLGATITISAVVQADSEIQQNNLFFQVFDPNGVVIASNNGPTMPATIDTGQQVSYSWQINNAGFTTSGTYSVTLCWSSGTSQNCDIASAKTTFFSVPTLGPELILVAAALLVAWFWYVGRRLKIRTASVGQSKT